MFALLKQFSADTERKAGAVMWAVRIAVARQAVTPGGATEIAELLGKNETLARVEKSIKRLAE